MRLYVNVNRVFDRINTSSDIVFTARRRHIPMQLSYRPKNTEMKWKKRGKWKVSRQFKARELMAPWSRGIGWGTRKRRVIIGPENECVTRMRERFPSKKLWRLWTSQRKVSGYDHQGMYMNKSNKNKNRCIDRRCKWENRDICQTSFSVIRKACLVLLKKLRPYIVIYASLFSYAFHLKMCLYLLFV